MQTMGELLYINQSQRKEARRRQRLLYQTSQNAFEVSRVEVCNGIPQ